MSKKRDVFLVTGAKGFLGRHVVPLLLRKCPGSRIIAVVRKEGLTKSYPHVQTVYGDLRDRKLWLSFPRNITHVFHLAAVIPRAGKHSNDASMVPDNLIPIGHLISMIDLWKSLKQVIYSSSIAVYGTSARVLDEDAPLLPDHLYGATKLAGEDLLKSLVKKKIRVACLRYSSLYGSGQYPDTVLPMMMHDAVKKRVIRVFGKGARTQDFLFGEDAAAANYFAFRQNASGCFNVGGGVATSMKDLASTVNKIFTENTSQIIFTQDGEGNPGNKISIAKAEQGLEYHPRFSLEQGLQKIKSEMERLH